MSRSRQKSPAKIIIAACLVVVSIIALSLLSVRLWGVEHKDTQGHVTLLISEEMSVAHFAEANGISTTTLKKILHLQSKKDLQKPLDSFGIPQQQLAKKVEQALVLEREDSSKNWLKIPLKFGLWLTVLIAAFFLMKKRIITPTIRKGLYLTSVLLFGVILGADPSPMGPVKDAITLYGVKGVIFKPRLVALSIFLATVILANKSICAWGCQIGTLQDLLFRMNRNKKDSRGVLRQYKPAFWISNSIRILFFSLFTAIAFVWATDIIESIDPFKIYKPAMVSGMGWAFLIIILVGSLFTYRPWCHFFCPFGIIGWIAEQISFFKIRVNRQTCTACGACSKACPSSVMGAIMADQTIKPDCFACGTCINVCPTKSISWGGKH